MEYRFVYKWIVCDERIPVILQPVLIEMEWNLIGVCQ